MTRPNNDYLEQIANGLGWFSLGLGAAELLAPGAFSRLIGIDHGPKTRALVRSYGLREIAAGVGILAQPRPAGWLWARVAGDAVDLASLGKALASDENDKGRVLFATAAVLGVTALDVFAGQRMTQQTGAMGFEANGRRRVTRSIIIDRPTDEVYRYWRDLSHLPQFMNQLESVQVLSDRRSHWKTIGPAGSTVEWDADIVKDEPNSLIAWRSVDGSQIENSGTVRFERAPGDRGTLLRAEISYAPPGGPAGAVIAKLFGTEPSQQLEASLRALKAILETGEVVRSDASIHRGMHAAQPPAQEDMPTLREGAESLRPSLV